MPALNPGLRGPFAAPFRRAFAPGAQSIIAQAISILRRYGQDAHIYLPGVGMLNGLQAGNYLDSAGATVGTVDQPVGLVLDAAGGLGVDIVVNGGFSVDANWTKAANWSISGGVATSNGGTGALQAIVKPLTAGKTYSLTFTITRYVSGNMYYPYSGTGGANAPAAVGTYTWLHVSGTTDLYLYSVAFNGDIDDVIVREVTGIAASQPTTSNKCILRQTGGRYNWVFDATDLLTATFPAGNESVTVIDALGTGQVTTTGVNVVGAYSMGPSVTLYGRMVIKGSLSASELATLQSYANRLAGV